MKSYLTQAVILLGAALLGGCGGAEDLTDNDGEATLGQDQEARLSSDEFAYRAKYEKLEASVQQQLKAGECTLGDKCGDLVFVNCKVEVDGPGYYVHTPSGHILEVCGGACRFPGDEFCVACPPPEWTCK